jgi:DNA-binding CsgD family transcriptional regulator
MIFLPVAELNSPVEASERVNSPRQDSEGSYFQLRQQPYLLEAVIEGFVDGILILTKRGDLVYSNTQARRICFSLIQGASQPNALAREIWRVCQSLSESYNLFPDRNIIIESEVKTDDSLTYRIRARWLDLAQSKDTFLFVTLEDRNQSNENQALAEVRKYKLTRREAEVWLLRRGNYSYQQIAAKLYISPNTVKKHIKNIYAKQEAIELTGREHNFGKFELMTR